MTIPAPGEDISCWTVIGAQEVKRWQVGGVCGFAGDFYASASLFMAAGSLFSRQE
jgi:hypothetical protein